MRRTALRALTGIALFCLCADAAQSVSLAGERRIHLFTFRVPCTLTIDTSISQSQDPDERELARACFLFGSGDHEAAERLLDKIMWNFLGDQRRLTATALLVRGIIDSLKKDG